MSFIWSAFLILLFSYFVGSIPFGLLIGKFNGLDIRHHGSCNIGATNIRRVLGRDWGIVCFLCDFLKGVLPVVIIGNHFGASCAVGPEWGELLAVVGTVAGHIFPCTLHFKGGKGVATSLGAILGIAFWPVLIGAILWYLCFLKTRIVSLASMVAAIAMPITALIMYFAKWGNIHIPAILLMLAIALLIIFRHKDNITRLKNGTENKFVKVKTGKK